MADRQPVRIRASSFGSLFDCPARWVAIHIEKRTTPQSGKAALGTAIHDGTAVFDKDRVAGQRPSKSAAVDAAMESIKRPRDNTSWEGSEKDQAARIALSLTGRYCDLESYRHRFVAVDASVNELHITDLGIVLGGTVDRVRETDEGYGISDLKTGKQAVGTDGRAKTHGHAAQMGVYELVGEAATKLPITAPAQIIGMQTNLTPDKQRIGTGEIVDARLPLLGDADHQGLLHMASKIVHGDIDPWGNPKSMMCHQNYCPNYLTCFYRR